jgi:hypothetical protein
MCYDWKDDVLIAMVRNAKRFDYKAVALKHRSFTGLLHKLCKAGTFSKT